MDMKRGLEPVREMRGVESCQVPPSALLYPLVDQILLTREIWIILVSVKMTPNEQS